MTMSPVKTEAAPSLHSKPLSPAAVGRPKIALFGLFGMQNLGNECTLQAMLYNVRQRLPEAELYSICYEPEDTMCRYNLPAIPVCSRRTKSSDSGQASARTGLLPKVLRMLFRRMPGEVLGWFKAVKALKGTDLVVMTGTGMLTDYATSAFGFPYDVFKWTIAARLAGCKVRFVGIGVGPIYEKLSRWFIKTALKLADYRSYRDDVSRQRLAKLGLDSSKDPVFPDLAFSLPREIFPECSTHKRQQRVVGLGVMCFVDIHVTKECDRQSIYGAYLNRMCDFVGWLVEHGYGVRILQGDARYDRAVRRDLRDKLQERGLGYERAGIVDEESASVDELLAQIVQTDVVISPRFHNLILSLMLNKPVISISYDPKNDALLEGFGLGKYCQPITDVNVQNLVKQFIDVDVTSEQVRPRIRKTVEEYRTLLDKQYSVILSQLRPRQSGSGS